MDRELKAKWVAALRSGNYKQGIGRLCNVIDGEETFCCLGVLCNIINPAEWSEAKIHEGYKPSRLFKGEEYTLPQEIREEIGISTRKQSHLQALNDHEKKDFESIAKWIEANL